MAKPLIAGNWKMNTTLQDGMVLATALQQLLEGVTGVEVVLCPPFVSVAAVAAALRGSPLKVGAQNMHHEDKGAFTGEVSAPMLRDLCQYVIVGHSERRRDFGETDEVVNRKVKKALEVGLRPILCVGESLEQRQRGIYAAVVMRSLMACLDGVEAPNGLVVAYEPVWAIGTGMAASGEQAQVMAGLVRQVLGQRFGEGVAASVPVLYGGSVTPANIQEFVSQPDIDGALVGGASLDAKQFAEIVRITARARAGRPG
ncbi:MAG: triose-phosphate isomerase [Dehalococcoidia bacterium]|nr:triose-phosphate isomerase [Dehalococcoidia bacterium]